MNKIATVGVVLAAHGLGLGAVWTGVFPAEDPAVKNKWNFAKIHADRW